MIPITVITGFLGSGKTTLLNNLITNNPDKKVVVIENEFGEVGVDGALLVDLDAQIFELSNGCICCNLNEDLQETLIKLLDVAVKPDHLIIETTGIADPAPIIASLLNDEIIQSNFQIDTIITLVDALFIKEQLNQNPQCYKQISLGNYIILNKIATVPKPKLEELVELIAQMNPEATIYATNFSFVKDINLLELNLFQKIITNTEKKRTFTLLNNSPYERVLEIKPISHNQVVSVHVSTMSALDILKFNTWLKALLTNSFGAIFRVKGFVYFEELENRILIQGVQNTYVTEKGTLFKKTEVKTTSLVFIGKNLNSNLLSQGIELCKATDSEIDFKAIYNNIEALQESLLAE